LSSDRPGHAPPLHHARPSFNVPLPWLGLSIR
jgi:hypothetical protein